ncbi:MAG: hypothetical protein AAGF99_10480 [Bacteroidota bacterium]
MTPEEQIARYASLSPAEQAEVDAYVATYPALRPLLDDVKRLHALTERLARSPVTDEDLAETLVARHFGAQTDEARARQARVDAALQADPTLRATYERMQARLDALHEASESPLAQFERLTGHRLDAGLTAVPRSAATTPAPAGDRPAARQASPTRRVAFPRWAIAAVVLCAAVGVGLFAAEPLLTPAHQQRADLASLTAALPLLRSPVRSATPGDTSATARTHDEVRAAYADALAEVEAAHTAGLLGLFEGYDSDALDRAAVLLRDVTAHEVVAPDLALDAEFAVGTIRLYQDRRSEACTAFERVVREQGPRSADAQALLDEFCNR